MYAYMILSGARMLSSVKVFLKHAWDSDSDSDLIGAMPF